MPVAGNWKLIVILSDSEESNSPPAEGCPQGGVVGGAARNAGVVGGGGCDTGPDEFNLSSRHGSNSFPSPSAVMNRLPDASK